LPLIDFPENRTSYFSKKEDHRKSFLRKICEDAPDVDKCIVIFDKERSDEK
jgi:hypothetical protein